MVTSNQIEETPTFKSITTKTKFFRKILLSEKSKLNINNYIVKLNEHGMNYFKNKPHTHRELNIAKEIIKNNSNGVDRLLNV